MVEIVHQDTGERIAVGQVNFSSHEAHRVARERTEKFDKIFGSNEDRVVMVHRDNLAITV